MITISREWLMKTIAELEEERDATPGVVNEDAAKALAAMKLALASLEAKAMTQVLSSRAGNDTSTIDKALPEGTMLYTAPPALVSVPDELTREEYKRRFMEEDNFDDTFRGGWSACRAAMLQGADGKPELTVWYGAMPETNGKTNWTAMLHRKGHHPWEGITIDRSEYPGRVRYEADRMRHLIGELADEPDILTYDSDAHSGYVEPVTTAYKLPFEQWLSQQTGTIDVECGCVMTEVFFHWLRVAYEAGNSPQCREISNSSTNNFRENAETSTKCWCRTCRPVTFADSHFVVCPECGNKRCPHANDHRHACTGSNEPGQEGSAYPAAPQQEVTQALAKGMERYGDAMQELAKKEVK